MTKIQTVQEYLSFHGPALSSDISSKFQKNGVSDVAARQRLSRLTPGIKVLKGLTFPKRARFLYLEKDFGSERYWKALYHAIKTANPAYAAAIGAIEACGGYVRRDDFDVISGSPVRQKKQISSETVLERLRIVNILDKMNDPIHGECVYLKFKREESSARLDILRARLITENVLLDAIRLWAGKMNISSPTATEIRQDSNPQYSTFRFHLCGPSYLRSLRGYIDKKTTPGFFVADIILGATLREENIAAFIRKYKTLSSIRSSRPFLPMLIADSFTKEALNLCRAEGVIATTPETLFGKDVATALADLTNTLINAGRVAASNPEKLENLFAKLSSIEGRAGNLRGALFELVVGHMVKQLEGGSIDIGKKIFCQDNKDREMDVCLFKEKNISIFECKGYQPDSITKKKEIEDWLGKVAQIYSTYKSQENYTDSNFTFEYWTCGKFDTEALELLNDMQSKLKKYKVSWKNGDEVRKYASGLSAPGIRKILEEHYFNHPINLISTTPRINQQNILTLHNQLS